MRQPESQGKRRRLSKPRIFRDVLTARRLTLDTPNASLSCRDKRNQMKIIGVEALMSALYK